MESNQIIKDLVFKVIKNQLNDNDPPETKITYDRLRKEGYDDLETRQMLGQCVAGELFDVLKLGKPFDNERFIKNLNGLPKEPS